jgi:hypothetical protein
VNVKMKPYLHVMPRVDRDIEQCLAFVGKQPWGKPEDRKVDIRRGIERALAHPESSHAEAWRDVPGIELRQCMVAQFVIVYAYLRPTVRFPRGIVSIRAVRHSRVRDVFAGVKEPPVLCGPGSLSCDA